MKTHRNIPFFVPHAGCPNCCVFCSQSKITGVRRERDLAEELSELTSLLTAETGLDSERQIAFFGGSFTAIERERMLALLTVARGFVERGRAESVRVSTRPDAIDEEILSLLRDYRVKSIELGVQSVDNAVLRASNRGHTAESSYEAARLIREYGFDFCGQMMVGLPGSSPELELETARAIVEMGAKEARIYPTVVFEGTRLYEMAKNGEYTPLALNDAVGRTAECARVFIGAGVKILKIGLHESENLKNAPMGANHPALGELVRSRIYVGLIADSSGDASGKSLRVYMPKNDISMLTGHGGRAVEEIKKLTGARDVTVVPTSAPRFTVASETV